MSLYGMELVVALVKQKTVKDGGNALALTDHRKPSLLGSSCHHIAARLENDSHSPSGKPTGATSLDSQAGLFFQRSPPLVAAAYSSART